MDNQSEIVARFVALTGSDADHAVPILVSCNWNLDNAVQMYQSQHGVQVPVATLSAGTVVEAYPVSTPQYPSGQQQYPQQQQYPPGQYPPGAYPQPVYYPQPYYAGPPPGYYGRSAADEWCCCLSLLFCCCLLD